MAGDQDEFVRQMERKSGLVWLIAPTVHSHPNDDIVLGSLRVASDRGASFGNIGFSGGDLTHHGNGRFCRVGGVVTTHEQSCFAGGRRVVPHVVGW